jgi:hypothetical protein
MMNILLPKNPQTGGRGFAAGNMQQTCQVIILRPKT